MSHHTFVISLLLSVFALLLPCDVDAEPLALSKNFWKDPDFVRTFLGSYQPNNRIEPFINDDERKVLQSLQALMREGKLSTAISRLRSNQLVDASPALRLNLGNLLFEHGKWREAASAYEAALKAYPDFRRAHAGLGFALVRQDRLKNALPHLQRAFALGDQSGTLLGLLGHCLLHDNKPHSALFAYQRAQITEPEQWDWKLGEAQCLHASKEHGKAVAMFAEVLTSEPNRADAWLLYAQALIAAQRYEDATATLELTDRLAPLSGNDLMTLGDLYSLMGISDSATARYRQALQANPVINLDLAINCVQAKAQQLQWHDARALLELVSMRENVSKDPRYQRMQALIEMEIGDPSEAADILASLLRNHPLDGEALILLARYRWEQKTYVESDILFNQAKLVSASEANACLEHARLQVSVGAFQKALENINRAKELKPSEPLAEYADQVAQAARSTSSF